eukprot:gene33184-40946_t
MFNIDLGGNRLTGTVPEVLFSANRDTLQTFSLARNCLSIALTDAICSLPQLTALILDGLGTECDSLIAPGGGIPECLLAMDSIQTLHLSGMRLTGKIPEPQNFSSSLIDLSLSHNDLHGSIPRAMQHRAWDSLDLSYNKLDGDLASNFLMQTVTFKKIIVGRKTMPVVDAQQRSVLRLVTLVTVVVVNIVLVLAANIGYIYIELTYNSATNAAAQIALACFKLFWNNFCLPRILERLFVKPIYDENKSEDENDQLRDSFSAKTEDQYMYHLNKKLTSASLIVSHLLWMLFFIVSAFYCFLLFDMVGDVAGLVPALKVSLLVFGCSVVVLIGVEVARWFTVHHNFHRDLEKEHSKRTEMMFDGLEFSERSILSQLESVPEEEGDEEESSEGSAKQKRLAELRRQKTIRNEMRKIEDAEEAAEDCCQTLF